MMHPINTVFGLFLMAFTCWGCQGYLSEKPVQSLAIPGSLDDLEAMLNHHVVYTQSPSLHELLADDFYVTTADWQFTLSMSSSVPELYGQCLSYVYDPAATHVSWNNGYQYGVYYANVVLDLLPELATVDQGRVNTIRGSALFHRAFTFERLVQLYAKPYSSASETDLGIVLRTASAIDRKYGRSTVSESYARIVSDLAEAAELLPVSSPSPTYPSKAAAYGVLSRVYLSMRDYVQAGRYADMALSLRNGLMDFNDYMTDTNPVFPEYNPEVIFQSYPNALALLASTRAKIDTVLYRQYDEKDLRKRLFFEQNTGVNAGTHRFRGSYLGRFNTLGNMVADGVTTDEMYLNRAECAARTGDLAQARADLNKLIRHRWLNDGSWQPIVVDDPRELLEIILSERRKELVFRGLRWTDLRRLNEEGRQITLTRIIDGTTHTLPPGDPRWVMLIPDEVINRSGLVQNPR